MSHNDHFSAFVPKHRFLVALDSDGCVLDTMEPKQKLCFNPRMISNWHLEPIAQIVHETAEFVNLYSRMRGRNRFIAIKDTMDLLRNRPEVIRAKVKLPGFGALSEWIKSGETLDNASLKKRAESTGDKELLQLLEWSLKVDAEVERQVGAPKPFVWAVKCLKKMQGHADAICISQTPSVTLKKEWSANNLNGFAALFSGPEGGTKAEQIRKASAGRYGRRNVIMIGDSPSDCRAADENGSLFYPIIPGREEESWKRFCDETLGRFLEGLFPMEYQKELRDEFEAALPVSPPWQV